MKIITYIYVFALYVLCSPGFFIKTKMNLINFSLHGLLFSIILYFTIGIVNDPKEGFDQATISMKGVDHLVNLIDSHKQQKQTNIDIQNEIKGAEDASVKCWNALGKTQKELETLRIQLDSYDGTNEAIENLNAQIIEYKDNILTLQRELEAYKGDTNSLEKLTIQFNHYKDKLEALQKQVMAFDGTKDSLENVNNMLSKMKSEEEKLNTELGLCNAETPGLTTNASNLQTTYNKNDKKIKELESNVGSLETEFNTNKTKIDSLEKTVKNKSYC